MNIIEQLEREEIARLAKTIPDFEPGDTVIVNVRVKEGERTRVQAYEASASPATAAASTRASPSARFPTARAWSVSSPCTPR